MNGEFVPEVLLKIHTKCGKGIGAPVDKISEFDQQEYLIARAKNFKVTKVREITQGKRKRIIKEIELEML